MTIRSICLISCCIGMLSCGKEPLRKATFSELSVPAECDITSIWFSDSLHGLATGGTAWEKGVILSTIDGGDTWQADTLLNRKMEQVCVDVNGQAYACGQDLILYKSPSSGKWDIFKQDYQWLRACHFPDGRRGAAVGGEGYHGGVCRTYGPDPFWALDTLNEFPNEISSVWYADSNLLVAAGFGWVMRSADAGRHWERLDITGDFFQSVHFPEPQTGYICGSAGTILKSTDAGQSWTTLRKGGGIASSGKAFRSLWFRDALNGWVVGDNGILWQTQNGGITWRPISEAPGDADFTFVYALGNTVWVCAQDGRIFRFTD